MKPSSPLTRHDRRWLAFVPSTTYLLYWLQAAVAEGVAMPEASAEVLCLLGFLNTVDVEEGTDALAHPESLGNWLVQQGLCMTSPPLTVADVQVATGLRQGLRSLALSNAGGPVAAEDVQAAQQVASELSFKLRFPGAAGATGSGPALVSAGEDRFAAALGTILTAYFIAAVNGEWTRVRRCPAADCAWVFWDSSKNASRRWCSMRICGNRAKARAFADRRRGTAQ
jgi:predicted RNA-binding Zn ribbon-like protein